VMMTKTIDINFNPIGRCRLDHPQGFDPPHAKDANYLNDHKIRIFDKSSGASVNQIN
jgi:hypothetical protein